MDDGRDADPGDGICDTGSRECTLRAAIQEANARAGLQIVRLQKGAYLLTLNGMSDDEGLSGDFDLLDDVIVRGVDSARTWVDGQTVDRLFHVHPGVDATLQNLTVQQGRVTGSNGGGVLNEGMLTLRSAMVNACATDLRGGGIYNADGAMLTLDGSTVAFSNAGDDGGGVANDGDMTAMVSTLSSNTAGDRGGALQVGPRAWAELINVTVYNNTAVMGGGLDPGAGTLQMVNTVVAGSIMGGDCAAPPLSLGHNLAGDLSCDLTETGDVQETDPQLTDLLVYTDSGIRTHYPSFESPGPNPTQGTGDATFIPQLDQNHQNWTEAGSTFKRSVVQLPLIDALASGRVYVRDSHQIRIFETLGHTQVGSIPGFVAGGHFVMHPSGTRMFMLNDDRLDFVDLDTGTITVGLPLVLPFGLAINPSGTRLFVPQFHSGASHITVVDTATLQSISSYTSQGTYIGQFPAVNKIGTALLTPTGAESVGLASPLAFTANEQLQPLATQSWPATWWPHAVRPGPGATFFTIDHHLNNPPDLQDIDSRLSFLQSSAAAPITVLTIPNAYATWCVVDPTGSRVYVNADDDLLVVDTLAAQLVTTVSGVGYGEVEIHPLEGAVYAANFTHGFSVISTTTFQVTTMYPDINDFGGLAVKP
jgi:CSLREA domain-containing protein